MKSTATTYSQWGDILIAEASTFIRVTADEDAQNISPVDYIGVAVIFKNPRSTYEYLKKDVRDWVMKDVKRVQEKFNSPRIDAHIQEFWK